MSSECCLKKEIEKPACICYHEELLSVLGKKWAVLILRIIQSFGVSNYNEIFGKISGITPKAFGDKLRILENGKLIERKVIMDQPLRTKYSLTFEGEKLLASLKPFFKDSQFHPKTQLNDALIAFGPVRCSPGKKRRPFVDRRFI